MLNKLLKPNEVAQILGVSRSFAYQLIKKGEIASIQMGRSVRVRPEDLDAFIQQRMRMHNAE
jgi:prophage regulatory protein